MESVPSEPSSPASDRIPIASCGSAAEAYDWAATPLGARDSWPAALKAAAGIVLGSNIPMMVGWGPELRLVHNDSYGELLGDRRPALGRPLSEVWADEWHVIGANVERVLRGETVYEQSAPRRLRRAGRDETAWMTFCYNPAYDEEGRVAGIFGVITAVSGDEQAARRIEETEERFRRIADAAPVPMWVTQLDRKRSFVNRAYVDFLRISYEQAVDFDWRTIIHPDDRDRILAESLAGEASLKTFSLIGRYRGGDGELHWLHSISQPRWGPGGEHVGFIGVAHDITEAKKAEAALREMNETLERRVEERTADLQAAVERLEAEVAERERAEEALRQAQKMEAVGRLTGGIAHDFNNLLTPVIGGLEIIAAGVEDPRLKRLAEGALESSRRGAKLTTQLLAFSRLQRIRIAPVAVNQVIGNLRRILEHTIGPGIEVRSDLGGPSIHALCDENQLENAVLNLAINARDAMPDGGTLSIASEVRREGGTAELAEGDYVCITVVDTGTGMPAEVAARATEPFFSTKPFGKGTGLGLAQVYGIARQAGGTVRIDSREGEGTTVELLLPHVEPDAAAARGEEKRPAGEAAEEHPAGARIAIVDDDPDVRAFISDLVDELGHRAEAFDSGEAALAALEQSAPDLVLVDFAMPGMNGAELARALRSRHPQVPIAFVTGFAESDQLEGALGPEVPVLRKPFGLEDLAGLLAELFDEGPAGG